MGDCRHAEKFKMGIRKTWPMNISHYTNGRANNFNLIRIAAAYAVMLSHSFPLAKGAQCVDPIVKFVGLSMGDVAVHVFFVISGFLVTASIFGRANIIEFLWARLLRVYPAMIFMILLTVFAIGLFFTTLSLGDYLQSHMTHRYLVRGLTLIGGVWFDLPGVFKDIPFAGVVNGSLWTMPYELRMYALLALIWYFMQFFDKTTTFFSKITIIFITSAAFVLYLYNHYIAIVKIDFFRLFYWFFIGSSIFFLKEKIYLSHSVFFVIIFALILSILDMNYFFVVYSITLPYIIFYIAYIPSGFIRYYNILRLFLWYIHLRFSSSAIIGKIDSRDFRLEHGSDFNRHYFFISHPFVALG